MSDDKLMEALEEFVLLNPTAALYLQKRLNDVSEYTIQQANLEREAEKLQYDIFLREATIRNKSQGMFTVKDTKNIS